VAQSDFVSRGQALVTSGQYQEAVKVCRLGLLGRPTTVEGRIVLGQALLALKRYDEVLAEMRVALELDRASVPAQLLKARALLDKGDVAASLDVLNKVRPVTPADQEWHASVLEEAQRSPARPALSASHPAVGFVGGSEPTNDSTKHYPSHGADEEDTEPKGDEDTGGSYTRPTSIAAPAPRKRSGRQPALADYVPPPAVLAIGDRSGTVEVDPELDGIEIDDDELGGVAAPPRAPVAARPIEGARGSVRRSSRSLDEPPTQRARPNKGDVSSVELDSADLVEIEEPSAPTPRRSRRGSAVRNAVQLPSGPIDQSPAPPAPAYRKTAPAAAVSPPEFLGAPLPAPPLPAPPPGPIAAALPTAAAMPLPGAGLPPAAMPLSPAQQASAAAVEDALFGAGGDPASPAWARATVVAGSAAHLGPGPHGVPHAAQASPHHAGVFAVPVDPPPQPVGVGRAGADEPTRRPAEIDPRIAAELGSSPSAPSFTEVAASAPSSAPSSAQMSAQMSAPASAPNAKALETGMRRGRSRLAIAMWVVIGAGVIGGGVFAGFQIRKLRLEKQIVAAREQAVSLAKADTWRGWAGARDRLAGIARASSTVVNRAALARARAVLAYEFGDGVAEAKAALAKLGTDGGLDSAIAAAYLALADHDAKAAKAAAERALALAPNDAAALYVAGQAALLAGDHKAAIASLRRSHERDPRALYAVGLARAIGSTGAWDEALAAVDRALGAMPDHPGALIERAFLLEAAGRIAPGNTLTAEVRTQLVKLIAEGGKPFAEQARGVSPSQLAFANLALARVDFALRDSSSALAAIKAAADVHVDEQRFGEEVTETLYALGDLERALNTARAALTQWPASHRVQVSLAQISLAQGKAGEALAILGRHPEAAALPRGQAVRGLAKLATGDLAGAAADLDAVLGALPQLELAIVGRAWVHLAAGAVEDARKQLEPRYTAGSPSVALATAYGATLRSAGDLAKAREVLDKAVSGPPGVDMPRAQLELGRVLRALGDTRGARAALAEAIRLGGGLDAKLENALLSIDDRDPTGGRDTIDQLLDKEPGAMENPRVVLEGARARMLAGDHAGAVKLLDAADKLPNVPRWWLARERGRLALRRGEVPAAARSLGEALDGCGDDPETFLLAADLVTVDPKQTTVLAQKVTSLVEPRIGKLPEALIVKGKLAIAREDAAAAEAAYVAAKQALDSAVPRRLAQAYYGLAVIAYNKGDDPNAQSQLDLVMPADPSIYNAYLYAAEIAKSQLAALELAKKAVKFNPEFVLGWFRVGYFAAKANKPKDLAQAMEKLAALSPGNPFLAELEALRR